MQPTSPTPPSRQRRRRKDARPGELAAAALELFAERGYAATRLEDVAAHVGLAKATVYLYFASKRALFDGVIREAIVPQLARSERRVERFRGATTDLLRETVSDWVQLMQTTALGRVPKLIAADADKFPDLARSFHDAVIARARNLLHRVLSRGVKRGEFRVANLDMVVEVLIAAMMMPSITRNSSGFHAGEAPDPGGYLETLIDLTLNGLVPRGRTPPVRPGRRKQQRGN